MQLDGVIVAPLLPMAADGSVNWAGFDEHVTRIVREDTKALALNMETGEGQSLSVEEACRAIRIALDAVGHCCPVLAALTASGTREGVEKARRLADHGAQGLIVYPAYYTFYSPLLPDMVWGYFEAIAETVPTVPLLSYVMPWAGSYPSAVHKELQGLPSYAGTCTPIVDTVELLELLDESKAWPRGFTVLSAADDILLESLLVGCHGVVSALANVASTQVHALSRAVRSEDPASACAVWKTLGPLARFCWRLPREAYLPRLKAVLGMQGAFDSAMARAPQIDLDSQERMVLRHPAEAAGLIGVTNDGIADANDR